MNKEGFWEISVRKAGNGFVCLWEEEDSDGEGFIKHEQVFEEKDSFSLSENKDELENMQNLLYFIKEFFGVMNSKHNKLNLNIKIDEMENND
jgi:hypothetical protein